MYNRDPAPARIRYGWLLNELWKACAAPWKFPVMVAGNLRSAEARLIAFTASPSAEPGARLKDQGDRGKLSLMVDRQVGDAPGIVLGHRRQRHHFAGERRLQVQLVERTRVGLQRRRDFQHHVVAVGLGEELGGLTLPEGIVEGLIHGSGLDAEARGLIALISSDSMPLLVC